MGRSKKDNVTLSVDKKLLKIMRAKGINLSAFFEKQGMDMFENKDLWIEVIQKGKHVYQEIKYLKRHDNDNGSNNKT